MTVESNPTPASAQGSHMAPSLDLDQLARVSGSGVLSWNTRTGTFRSSHSLQCAFDDGQAPFPSSGNDFRGLLHADDLPGVLKALEQHIEQGVRFETETRFLLGERISHWYLLRGNLSRAQSTSLLDRLMRRQPEGHPEELILFIDDIQTRKTEEIRREGLLAGAEQLAKEMRVLNELSQALTTRLSLRDVLEETFLQTSRLVNTSNFYIALYVPEKEEAHFVYDVTDSEQDKNELTIVPATRGITGYIIKNRVSVLIKDSYLRWTEAHGIKTLGEPALSWLGVPMLIGDRVLGVIAVQHYKLPNLYDEHSQELLTAIASSTAIAIQNARLFEERKQAEADLQTRSDQISRLVTPMLDSIDQTAKLTVQKKQTLEQLAAMTQESHEKLKLSDQNIRQVASSVEDMMNMVSIIGSISVTVNLLALNATIEAAHAGSLGRGFGVIAGEVRKLSDSTEGQAQEIAATLEIMTQGAKASAQASSDSFQTFSQTEVITQDILSFLEELSTRMTQLSLNSQDILESMGQPRT